VVVSTASSKLDLYSEQRTPTRTGIYVNSQVQTRLVWTHSSEIVPSGLDFEMAIYEHYYEALDVMGELFAFIFDGIADRYVTTEV
jgi:hypothetical protein